MKKMDPEIKAAWRERLDSGEIEQAHGVLSRDGKKCCLGVLCDLAVAAGVLGVEANGGDSGADRYYALGSLSDESDVSLPKAALDWAGIEHDNGRETVTPLGHFNQGGSEVKLPDGRCLSIHNDTGKSFTQISGLIEECL